MKYFTNLSLVLDYGGVQSNPILIERGAPPGSCRGPVVYITSHHDLPYVFTNPNDVHAYVDDYAVVYPPSIHLPYKQQILEIQHKIDEDMSNLHLYASTWLQPVNPSKIELVVYHASVQARKPEIVCDRTRVVQSKCFKYLGYDLDAKLSFQALVTAQTNKMQKTYQILKYIHRQFPASVKLKNKAFSTCVWPNMKMVSSVYCLLAKSTQNRVAAFHRKCLRLIFNLFLCPTVDLHQHFQLASVEEKYKTNLSRRMINIQQYDLSLIDCILQHKNLRSKLFTHYREKSNIRHIPCSRSLHYHVTGGPYIMRVSVFG